MFCLSVLAIQHWLFLFMDQLVIFSSPFSFFCFFFLSFFRCSTFKIKTTMIPQITLLHDPWTWNTEERREGFLAGSARRLSLTIAPVSVGEGALACRLIAKVGSKCSAAPSRLTTPRITSDSDSPGNVEVIAHPNTKESTRYWSILWPLFNALYTGGSDEWALFSLTCF